MSDAVVYIAKCPEHGLHGERDECFVCGLEVEHVTYVRSDLLLAEKTRNYRLRRLLWQTYCEAQDGSPTGFTRWLADGGPEMTPEDIRELREEYDRMGERELRYAAALELIAAWGEGGPCTLGYEGPRDTARAALPSRDSDLTKEADRG